MICIKEYKEEPKEYVAYYEITGYNIEEGQDDYIADALTSWVTPINRFGKTDIKKLTDKMIIGIHSEYKQDVDYDFMTYALQEICGNSPIYDEDGFDLKPIPCPNLYKNDKYYLVDSDEFIDKEELTELWNNSFVGWEDADVDFPTTLNKFIKQCVQNGTLREVEFI